MRTLKAIGWPTDSWDDLIIHLITNKLDHITNKEWENSITEADIHTVQRLTDFLEHGCYMLEAITRKVQPSSQPQTKGTRARVSSHDSSKSTLCQKCKRDHQIYSCKQFLKLSPENRLKFVKENKLCSNCMKISQPKRVSQVIAKRVANGTIRYCIRLKTIGRQGFGSSIDGVSGRYIHIKCCTCVNAKRRIASSFIEL